MPAIHPLEGVEAFVFDVFGTVVDWQGSITKQLIEHSKGLTEQVDWLAFAKEWRAGYMKATRDIAAGGQGSTNIDTIHREILDSMLASHQWENVGHAWDESKRKDVNLCWHKLHGWPDASEGLYALKKQAIIGTLSNGNVRLLVDMAKYADLPWDVVFSGELLGSYKPNAKVYLGALQHLSLPPSRCALVAAHVADLRAAASHGFRTVYVRRPTEGINIQGDAKSKVAGGEFDVVVDSFLELVKILKR